MKPLVLSFITSRYPSSTFGEFIRKARLETRLRRVDVAAAIGADENRIVNWEKMTALPWQCTKLMHLCEKSGLD